MKFIAVAKPLAHGQVDRLEWNSQEASDKVSYHCHYQSFNLSNNRFLGGIEFREHSRNVPPVMEQWLGIDSGVASNQSFQFKVLLGGDHQRPSVRDLDDDRCVHLEGSPSM